MRVIEHGEISQWAGTQVKCYFCKAVLEVTKDDLISWHEQYYGFYEEPYDPVGVKCPECGTKVEVRDVPYSLQREIRK